MKNINTEWEDYFKELESMGLSKYLRSHRKLTRAHINNVYVCNLVQKASKRYIHGVVKFSTLMYILIRLQGYSSLHPIEY